ncbi:dihydrofolate reductase [Parasphingorhabdus sp.]|uniref:dihydrofolate reductase n=1 Tax=Parasphingorhabdus sp. TaxID=2709688 RepID=UPI003264E4F8
MDHPEIILILARADNDVIGKDGALPWHLPADLRRFKSLSQGKPMIMGRKTFESLPGILPGRRHIVLTRDKKWEADSAEVAHDLDSAIRTANAPHIVVIGGAEIYRLFLPLADRIEITEVHAQAEGDTKLDDFDLSDFAEIFREHHVADEPRPPFSFVTLTRNKP